MSSILELLEANEKYKELQEKKKKLALYEELKKALYSMSNEELKVYLGSMDDVEYVHSGLANKVANIFRDDKEKYDIYWADMKNRIDRAFGKSITNYVFLRIVDKETGWEHEVPLKKYENVAYESQKELKTFDDLKIRMYPVKYNDLLREVERGIELDTAVDMITRAINKRYRPDEATNEKYLKMGIQKLENLAGIEIISYSINKEV